MNYDGIGKYRTSVGDDVFIGCNVNLLSPVTLQNHCFIAAGSTINKEVPVDALGVARTKQRNVEGWFARREERVARKSAAEAGESGSEGNGPGSSGSKA